MVDTAIGSTPDRQLPTTVWYPNGPAAQGGRAPAGPYPLLIFSQGFNQSPASYGALIEAWASAGFVVAGPHYPYTDPQTTTPAGPAPTRADLGNHPTDLAAAVAAVMQASRTASSPLNGLVASDGVGAVGQSDGADVSLAVGTDSCCRLQSVKAVVSLSGSEDSAFSGTYFVGPTPPLLVVQGSADVINPAGCSAIVYDAAPTPKYYLDLLGATHLPPYETTTTPWEPVVAEVTTDFFEAELVGRNAAMADMLASGNRTPGVTTLSVGGESPETTQSCSTTTGAPTTAGGSTTGL